MLSICLPETAVATRNRMPLECFERGALRYVGLRDGNAIVVSPDNVVHRLRRGDYLGLNDGKVARIARDRIEIIEILPDGKGGWMESPAVLRRLNDRNDVAIPHELLVDHCPVRSGPNW